MPTMTEKQKKQARALHSVLKAVRKHAASAVKGATLTSASMVAAKVAAAGEKDVALTCSHPGCVVGITCAGLDFSFVTGISQAFPTGAHDLFYRVQGPAKASFTIAASGAKMPTISDQTDGKGLAGGARPLVVG